ncbi:ABC transporter substrate-binding protein [Candidatus Bipolaricaulota bacterium]|nr:ABC transporter substrate-binding protein [Candidatus Bipolaricaulota bacterium]
MIYRNKGLTVVVLLAFLVSGLFVCGTASDLENITFKLNWIPGGDHTPYFVAKEKGFYEEEGLKVKIERGRGSADTVKRVELGTVDVGLADTGTLAVSRSEGAKVKVVAMIYNRSPNAIFTVKGSGIETPKDLEGKKVGVPPGDAQRILFPALAAANDIDQDKVRLINIKPGAKASALGAGRVDAVFNWTAGNVTYWEAGIDPDDVVGIMWANWGVNPYGNAILASDKAIQKRPETLKKFLRASMRAFQWSYKHPHEAVDIFTDYNTEVPRIAALIRFVNDAQKLISTKAVENHVIGWIDHERMQHTVNLINKYFEVEEEITAKEMYTRELLPYYSLPSLEKLPALESLREEWEAESEE